jgi:hypothetical protein
VSIKPAAAHTNSSQQASNVGGYLDTSYRRLPLNVRFGNAEDGEGQLVKCVGQPTPMPRLVSWLTLTAYRLPNSEAARRAA